MISFGKAPSDSRVVAGRFERRVSPASIAPTLARLLHITPPAGCIEDPLVEVLPKGTRAIAAPDTTVGK
jgi:hypothetical protein